MRQVAFGAPLGSMKVLAGFDSYSLLNEAGQGVATVTCAGTARTDKFGKNKHTQLDSLTGCHADD